MCQLRVKQNNLNPIEFDGLCIVIMSVCHVNENWFCSLVVTDQYVILFYLVYK